MRSGLRIHRNGQPIPGSVDDPEGKVAGAVLAVMSASGLALFGAIAALFLIVLDVGFGIDFFTNLGFSSPGLAVLGVGALLEGAIFWWLSQLIANKMSIVALLVAIALQTANIGFKFMEAGRNYDGGSSGGSIVAAAVLILFGMLQGVVPLQKLKAEKAALQAEDIV